MGAPAANNFNEFFTNMGINITEQITDALVTTDDFLRRLVVSHANSLFFRPVTGKEFFFVLRTKKFSHLDFQKSNCVYIFSRSSSITEDGVTSRFKEEFRGGSVKRDSTSREFGIGSIRENSVTDLSIRRERESSLTRDSSRLSSAGVTDDLADLRSKYSPSNYVPTIHRKNENIIRSKSISDIGLPPIEKTKMKVTEVINYNVSVLPTTSTTTTTNDNCSNNDNNGNRASVADLRKRFDTFSDNKISKSPLSIEAADVKVSHKKFKLLGQTNLKVKDENNGARTEKKSIQTETNVKRIQMKSDKIKADLADVKVIQIPGIHKDPDEQSNSRDSSKMGNLDKHRNGIDKRDIDAEKKIAINAERQKARALVSKENGSVDHCDVLPIEINIVPTKLTNGIVASKTQALDSTEEVDDETNGGQINAINSISDLRLENFANASSVENLYRTNNFASYISSKDLDGGDKQPTIVNVVFQSENDESQYAEKSTIYSKVSD
ncbi:hypothetical protein WA026_012736 [Henosepilachna vigintioctopunctata]|uniref:Uncharacterized protein n=1 Tax=Henosepilachna vigintioctopunctata TaxID=420089 RepID=A0AAW1U724_9CUCU